MQEIHIYPNNEDVTIHIHKPDPPQIPNYLYWHPTLDPYWYQIVGDVPSPPYKITTTSGTISYTGKN